MKASLIHTVSVATSCFVVPPLLAYHVLQPQQWTHLTVSASPWTWCMTWWSLLQHHPCMTLSLMNGTLLGAHILCVVPVVARVTGSGQVALVLQSLGLVVLGTGLLYVVAVLFGVTFIEHYKETLLWAWFVCHLTILMPSIMLRTPEAIHLFIDRHRGAIQQHANLFYPTVLGLLGAWASSIVVPLDWERRWQKWPIPATTGALAGYFVGILLAIVISSKRKDGSERSKKHKAN